jgi:hypothetical protein
MPLSAPTSSLLQEIDAFSGHRLLRREDLGLLIDCAEQSGESGVLADLAFQAKFARKTRGIMERIGRDGEGYDRLARELSLAVDHVRKHLGAFVNRCPELEPARARYLSMSPGALEELFSLMNDLSWYKNWLIDRS